MHQPWTWDHLAISAVNNVSSVTISWKIRRKECTIWSLNKSYSLIKIVDTSLLRRFSRVQQTISLPSLTVFRIFDGFDMLRDVEKTHSAKCPSNQCYSRSLLPYLTRFFFSSGIPLLSVFGRFLFLGLFRNSLMQRHSKVLSSFCDVF